MTASSDCKMRGFTLAEMSRAYGLKPGGGAMCGVNTLREYKKNKPIVFCALLNHAEKLINENRQNAENTHND